MFHALSWIVVGTLLALWSLAARALHAVAVWTLSSAGALSGAAFNVGAIALPDLPAPWVPTALVQDATQVMASVGRLVDGLLQAAPGLAGAGLTVAAWVFWTVGSVLLLLLGLALHPLIARWHRRGGNGPDSKAGPSLAAG